MDEHGKRGDTTPVAAARAEVSETVTVTVARVEGTYRGLGPRGYVRSDQRIYEDICDRLSENPFIDASDIEVAVRGATVTLAGAVDSAIAKRQAEEIAREVAGVREVHSDLIVCAGDERGERTPGDQVNAAIGPPRRR